VEPSLGSTFKNPPGDYAGRLIQAAGLQGDSFGGIEVSHTHANFLINRGGVGQATASDVARMIEHIQQTVFQQYGVKLEPEIQWYGEWE
jgi:UDP-N-acetylmuramate dehydrogenase